MSLPEHGLTELTFHLIVEAAPSAVLVVSHQGRIAYVNRQCERLFGYEARELIGQFVEVLIPERIRTAHPELRQRFFAAPTMRSMGSGRELAGCRKDGSEFPVEIGLNPLVLVDGTWVLATIIDVSERKQEEEQFRRLLFVAPNAILLVNPNGDITFVNRQATVLFGYEERELLCKKVEELLPERFRSYHGALRASFLTNPQARYMGAGRDLVALRKDGVEVPVEIGLNPLQTDSGMVVLVSILDISERKQREELRSKKEAAEAAYKAKGELLAIATHDLKNPLSAISGLVELMLETKRAEPDVETAAQDVEFLETIQDAARHMLEVVRGILSNEGVEQQELTKEDVNLSELCADVVHMSATAAEKKGLMLVSEIQHGAIVTGDPTRLREALDNYISNAIKYSPSEKCVTVVLRGIPGEALVEFGVRDEGPGLTDDDKAKVFGKFKKLSAKPTGGESSTGLGLSIVKTIIELHGGEVGCDSTAGQGAYFWARLPVQRLSGVSSPFAASAFKPSSKPPQ